MDYKQIHKMLEWNIHFSKLKGTESLVLILMAVEQDYKTGEVRLSAADASKVIGISRQAIHGAIKSLIDKQIITIIKKGVGALPATYKIRSAESMNTLFVERKPNPDHVAWRNERSEMFGDTVKRLLDIESEIMGCAECIELEDDAPCLDHRFDLCDLKETDAYKRMLVWESDNPEPSIMVNMIGDNVC